MALEWSCSYCGQHFPLSRLEPQDERIHLSGYMLHAGWFANNRAMCTDCYNTGEDAKNRAIEARAALSPELRKDVKGQSG